MTTTTRIAIIGAGHSGICMGMLLKRADRAWLERLVSRRERPEELGRALERTPDDIKVVVQFADV